MISTGIPGLDTVLTGLKLGDNVVWQIDDIQDYIDLVEPFAEQTLKENKRLVYMRFASHQEMLKPSENIQRYELDAFEGFESFATKVNNIITEEGEGVYYVFDCLSELLSAWATDLMIGNFFVVTCPYLFELGTVTYFSIFRTNHSFKSIARIRETTQLLLDAYRCEGHFYIHPLKVWKRYSPTMFLPHQKEGDVFVPITDSVNAVKLLSYMREKGAESAKRNLDYWDRLFLEAEELLDDKANKKQVNDMKEKLCSLMIGKSEKILDLAQQHCSLVELLEIKSRLIGTGYIGGKSVGMLLARKILSKSKLLDWQNLSEPHDSFYIGSDIFYSYMVQNQLWKLRMQQKTEDGYFSVAKDIQEKILAGTFPEEIMEHFHQIIEYFGMSPIIIRSSSLLEDGFGNAFAGKYESVFLANQGNPERRYKEFAAAVKKIYASTMSENALVYRKKRGLDKMDEQMALLVQRVSGSHNGNYFFPDLAGVGVSHNIYMWNESMDPKTGMLRLVFGLGTRAVDRVEGDYPRMVALDNPLQRPYAQKSDLRKFSQHKVDVINIQDNEFQVIPFEELIRQKAYEDIHRVAIKDDEAIGMMSRSGREDREYWILTLDKVFKDDAFAEAFTNILRTLEDSYNYPVEIEFTVNFTGQDTFKINVLQCRPLQARGHRPRVEMPKDVKKEDTLFESYGYFLGGNVLQEIKRVIYVDPEEYIRLILPDKYEIARIVGRLNASIEDREKMPTLLMGPGRWGTTTPSLGVPVSFSEINNVAALAEIAFPAGNLMPELSFGTHFFQDLVETNIFYVALFPDKEDVIYDNSLFKKELNLLPEFLPQSIRYQNVVGMYDVGTKGLKIISDVISQKIICFSGAKKTSNR
ncbi:MAG: PEP/pyruvate-binding domain-containing protein [Candidatus Omnitrophica bacterium]|nr:PEP/pyruvate-binding domain-containing protein [Candidatus Omnitrophota bacterium]